METDTGEKPTIEVLWLMTLLKHKAEMQRHDAVQTCDAERPLRPEDAGLGTLCGIIETIGKVEHRLSGAESSLRSLDVMRKCLPAVASFLYEWPNGVAALCSRWQKRETKKMGTKVSLRSTFAWACQGIVQNKYREQRRNTLFVLDAVLRYASSELPGWAVDVRARDLRQLSHQGRAYCRLTRAAEISGVPRHTMIRLIRRGRVPYRVAHRGTRVIYEIEAEIARKLRLEYRPALLSRQGSRHLGVTHSLYSDLRGSGILRKVHETMMPSAIAVCDLDEFKRSVLTKAKEVASADGMQSLGCLRYKKCPRNVVVRIVEDILRGSIRCFHTGAISPQRINELLVRTSDIAPMIANVCPRPPPTIRQFQVRYHLSTYEAHTLVRYLSGVPSSDRRIRPGTVNEGRLEEFMACYCGLDAYARGQGLRYLAVLTQLKASKVNLLKIAVAKPPGRFVYFVPRLKRAEVARRTAALFVAPDLAAANLSTP